MKQLKYVLTLAREGSFSRAAEALNISQPSLSQYIKKIETQMGVELFSRVNGEVHVTDAGQIYLETGRKILDLETQMEHRFSDLGTYQEGTVSIGISPYRSVHLIPAVLRAFHPVFPGIKLVIKERSGCDLMEGALHGDYDLCVTALPVDEQEFFDCEVVGAENLVIAVGTGNPLYEALRQQARLSPDCRFPVVDIHAIDQKDFAMLRADMPMRQATDQILNRYGITVREKIEVSSNEALLSVAGSDICASLVPSEITNAAPLGIAFFGLEQESMFREIAVLIRKGQYCSQPMRKLIEIFKAVF